MTDAPRATFRLRGRESEVAALSRRLEAVLDGRGGVVLVSGLAVAQPGDTAAVTLLRKTVLPDGDAPASARLLDMVMLGLLATGSARPASGPGCWPPAASPSTG